MLQCQKLMSPAPGSEQLLCKTFSQQLFLQVFRCKEQHSHKSVLTVACWQWLCSSLMARGPKLLCVSCFKRFACGCSTCGLKVSELYLCLVCSALFIVFYLYVVVVVLKTGPFCNRNHSTKQVHSGTDADVQIIQPL